MMKQFTQDRHSDDGANPLSRATQGRILANTSSKTRASRSWVTSARVGPSVVRRPPWRPRSARGSKNTNAQGWMPKTVSLIRAMASWYSPWPRSDETCFLNVSHRGYDADSSANQHDERRQWRDQLRQAGHLSAWPSSLVQQASAFRIDLRVLRVVLWAGLRARDCATFRFQVSVCHVPPLLISDSFMISHTAIRLANKASPHACSRL